MARTAVVACVLVVLAACAWLLFATDEQQPLTVRPALAQAPAEPRGEPVTAAPGEAAATAPTGRTTAPDEAAAQPAVPEGATRLDVLIVDKLTEQPIAGAEAVWSDDSVWTVVNKMPPAEREAWYRDGERFARRFGWHGRSDAEGRLRIHLGKHGTLVFARAGGRFGQGYFQPAQETPAAGHRVLLEEDLTVRVIVSDALGRPAPGVPLALEPVDPDTLKAVRMGGTVPTDDEGLATFAHMQGLRTFGWGKHRGKPIAQWVVRLGIPELAGEPTFVDAQSPPTAPVAVKLSPSGRLRLRATFAGKVPPDLGGIAIHLGHKVDPDEQDHSWTRVEEDGWARFRHVPLGKRWFVGTHGSWEFELAGPTVQDQEVTASFELDDKVVALTGRLLDVDGAPLGDQLFMAHGETSLMSGSLQVRTDAGGRFVLILGQPREKQEMKLRQLSFERRVEGSATTSAKVPPRDLVAGANEVGDLRFAVDALVVSGRLSYDTPGAPMNRLQIQRLSETGGRNGQVTSRWNSIQALEVAAQEDGRFEVRGTLEPGRYRIWVPAYNHLPVEPVEFTPGARDVVISIRRGHSLAVTCRMPKGLDAWRLQLRLEPTGATARPKGSDSDHQWHSGENPLVGSGNDTDDGARYYWAALEPGTYELLAQGPGFSEPFLTIANVAVPAPEGGDPRLRALDLRASIDGLRVLMQSTGSGERTCFVFPQPQAEDRDWGGFGIAQGETVLPVPKRPVDLLFAGQGVRPILVRGAKDLVEVKLEGWPELELRFTGIDALPAGARLMASVRSLAPEQRRNTRYNLGGDAGPLTSLLQMPEGAREVKAGTAMLPIGEGVMSLSVFVQIGNRGRPGWLKQVSPNEVIDGPAVTVQLSAEEIRTALEALQAEKK